MPNWRLVRDLRRAVATHLPNVGDSVMNETFLITRTDKARSAFTRVRLDQLDELHWSEGRPIVVMMELFIVHSFMPWAASNTLPRMVTRESGRVVSGPMPEHLRTKRPSAREVRQWYRFREKTGTLHVPYDELTELINLIRTGGEGRQA